MPKQEYLECGKIINTHGVRGEVKLESWCDSPEVLRSLPYIYIKKNNDYVKTKVLRASIFKQFVIMSLEGFTDIDIAQTYKNTVVYASRDCFDLEEGGFFIADIIGLDVIDAESGKVYGQLADVTNLGASDIYVVKTESGEKMIPAVDEFIKKVDVENGIYVSVIEGMFD